MATTSFSTCELSTAGSDVLLNPLDLMQESPGTLPINGQSELNCAKDSNWLCGHLATMPLEIAQSEEFAIGSVLL